MAQVDSGLGWLLEERWLTNVAGARLGYKGRLYWNISGFENQNVPVTGATFSEVSTNGLAVLSDSSDGSSNNTWFVGANYDNVLITLKGQGRPFTFWFITDKPGVEVYVILKNRSDLFLRAVCNTQIAGAGGATYYYGEIYNGAGNSWYNYAFCPVNYNLGTQVQNVRSDISIEITKTNAGVAAGGLVKWATSAGVEFKTPILISSVSENVDMTCTSSLYNLAKLNILHQGMRFYMSFFDIPLSVGVQSELQGGVNVPTETPVTLDELFGIIASSSYANIFVGSAPDPYEQQTGESREDGGDGEDDDEDAVDFTDPPSTSIGATGLLTIFCPNLYQLQSLGNYMWSTFDVDNWRKIIANPMDAILGLHTLPVPATITGTKAVKVAGIDTTIDMSYTTVRYITRPMGTCEIPKKWGAYLDYSPYTKISIFLPFIGFKELDADDVMGQTISLQYIIDILTGACVAELKCGSTVLYSWSGNCANEVPITGADWRGGIASAISIAATIAGTALVTGGATAPMAASMVASVGANSMNLKPTINRSGAISGSAGYMSQKRPYIIRSIPNLVIPADQNKFIGYPSFVNATLGDITGYNEIASVHLEGIPATGNELAEIETLLKGGVIL